MEINSEKKKIILESTLELVREFGFHGFPISEVANRGGVAVGTIYYYFEGKDQLIQELYLYVVDLIFQEALKKDDASMSFKERYFIFWNNLVDLYHSKPAILSFFELYNNSSYYSDEAFVREGKFYKWLFMFFEEGLKSGELKPIDKEVLAVLVLGNMHTTAKVKMNRSLRSGNKPIDLDKISKIIWEGISNKT